MSEQEASSEFSVTLTRKYRWPAERICDAWTKPEWCVQWMRPNESAKTDAEIDLTVGGRYRFTIRQPDGKESIVYGIYREIDRPQRLVFTWKWEESPVEQGETLVTVNLAPTPDGTLLTLTHERLSSRMSAEGHTQGWTGCLNQLEVLAARS